MLYLLVLFMPIMYEKPKIPVGKLHLKFQSIDLISWLNCNVVPCSTSCTFRTLKVQISENIALCTNESAQDF